MIYHGLSVPTMLCQLKWSEARMRLQRTECFDWPIQHSITVQINCRIERDCGNVRGIAIKVRACYL